MYQHIRAKQLLFAFVCQAKIRIEIQPVEVILHQPHTETIDCGNMRVMQKHLLFLQALIIRMLFQAIIKGSRKPLAHLFCGRSRKGKYQQVIYIHRMFRVRQRADVFDQNRCLAASGGSSNTEDPGFDYR